MFKTVLSFLIAFAFWLVLTTNTRLEIAVGFVIALLITIFTKDFLFFDNPKKFLTLRMIVQSLKYFIVFLKEELKANIQTFLVIITGNIIPAIVRIPVTSLESDTSKALLADSITLTPGTFTLEIKPKDALYIHCLKYKKGDVPGRVFEKNIKDMKI